MSSVPTKILGQSGIAASIQGLGCMGMSFAYTSSKSDDTENLKVFDRALELGVNLLNSAQFYGFGHNEKLIGQAIKGRREKWVITTKCGITWDPETRALGMTGNPEQIKKSCDESLKRLATDYIDFYILARPDASTPIEDTVKAFKELIDQGKIKQYGLSEHTPELIRRAHAVHPCGIAELEWSVFARDAEQEIIPTLRELGIPILAYSPLGRGFLGGQVKSRDDLAEDDWRRTNYPPMSEENFPHNLELVERVKAIATAKGCTPGQVALAWVHAQGEDVIPIPGTKQTKYLEQNVGALAVQLTPEDVDALNFDVKGTRYNNMALRV